MAKAFRLNRDEHMAVFRAHVRDIDDSELIGGFHPELLPCCHGRQLFTALQNRKGAFEPPEIIYVGNRRRHCFDQNFQNGFFWASSGWDGAENASGLSAETGTFCGAAPDWLAAAGVGAAATMTVGATRAAGAAGRAVPTVAAVVAPGFEADAMAVAA